jgi:23S rRNA (cytosine1962-C5)-methyltransferase
MTAPLLYLKKREDGRIRRGHPWVFSNEIDVATSPLTDFEPGQAVSLRAHGGRFLGNAYVNPHALICARIVSTLEHEGLDRKLLAGRIAQALALRERLYPEPFYRLVYGESDGLPGLVVDRYDRVLVVQIGTAGMERLREDIISALNEVVGPGTVVLRNDIPSRKQEGLECYTEIVGGNLPEVVGLREHGLNFQVSLASGQKTGWFFDHGPNRQRLCAYAPGARVLDLFSYCGAWGVQAAAAGASSVLCVDTSQPALEQAGRNASFNGVDAAVSVRRGDAFEVVKSLKAAHERFDVVVLDPPAFVRRRKDVASGVEAYRRINRLAMELLGPGGILVSASCSSHLRRDKLMEVLVRSASALDRRFQITEQGHQGPDHPVHPALPESDYLKVFFARMM